MWGKSNNTKNGTSCARTHSMIENNFTELIPSISIQSKATPEKKKEKETVPFK